MIIGIFVVKLVQISFCMTQAERLVASGKAVFVDVRPEYEYEQQHLPGAINIPLYQAMEATGFYADLKRCAES
jgi:rhodanese-related sulfurtransferase